LRNDIAGHLDSASRPFTGEPAPKAIIAPHAGYRYSGPIAATAYARLAPARGIVRRVLLAGPAHRVPLDGVAVPSSASFATPLGEIEIDDDARSAALAVAGVVLDDAAHAGEHSLEVQLPFLAEVLGSVMVLPMLVRAAGVDVLTAVFEALWGGDETRIVVSTDLSHYHDQAAANSLDRETAAAIVERYDVPSPDRACGEAATRSLLQVARRRGLTVRLLDLRTSADTAGEPERVVGYGAFALT
jgi:hypothetical protein